MDITLFQIESFKNEMQDLLQKINLNNWEKSLIFDKINNFCKEAIEHQEISLDVIYSVILKNTHRIKFSKKEYEILEFCILNKNKIITRKELIKEVWKDDSVTERLVTSYISFLRKKLEIINCSELITTIRNAGYYISSKQMCNYDLIKTLITK